MKSRLDSIGSHLIAEMTSSPTNSTVSAAVKRLPVPSDSAMVAFLAQRDALRSASRPR